MILQFNCKIPIYFNTRQSESVNYMGVKYKPCRFIANFTTEGNLLKNREAVGTKTVTQIHHPCRYTQGLHVMLKVSVTFKSKNSFGRI